MRIDVETAEVCTMRCGKGNPIPKTQDIGLEYCRQERSGRVSRGSLTASGTDSSSTKVPATLGTPHDGPGSVVTEGWVGDRRMGENFCDRTLVFHIVSDGQRRVSEISLTIVVLRGVKIHRLHMRRC